MKMVALGGELAVSAVRVVDPLCSASSRSRARSSSATENARDRSDSALAFRFLAGLGLRSCSAASSLTVLAPWSASSAAFALNSAE